MVIGRLIYGNRNFAPEWHFKKINMEKKLDKYQKWAKKYVPITELRKDEIVSLYHLYDGNYKKI